MGGIASARLAAAVSTRAGWLWCRRLASTMSVLLSGRDAVRNCCKSGGAAPAVRPILCGLLSSESFAPSAGDFFSDLTVLQVAEPESARSGEEVKHSPAQAEATRLARKPADHFPSPTYPLQASAPADSTSGTAFADRANTFGARAAPVDPSRGRPRRSDTRTSW